MQLAFLLLLLPATAYGAGAIYKCVGANGSVEYSQIQCSAAAEKIELGTSAPAAVRPEPNELAAPQDAAPAALAPSPLTPVAPPQAPDWPAYRCHTPDGMVFYRHAHCPKSIAVTHYGYVGGYQTSSRGYAPVEEQGVPLDQACAAIYATDAKTRFGSGYDDRYSTYDRNAGRDPCR
jgi:hypothetical protein